MGANFQPEVYPYKETGSFRFWCQKVLPLVYDDSLSYYELLCKVVKYLNDVIANVDGLHADILSTNEAFMELQEFCNSYFDSTDFQSKIDEKLDEMVEDGTMEELLNPVVGGQLSGVVSEQIDGVVASQIGDVVGEQIGAVVAEQIDEPVASATTEWLNDHVDPVGSAVIVDSSLEIEGAAADAKVVGERFDDTDNAINTVKSSLYDNIEPFYYIDMPMNESQYAYKNDDTRTPISGCTKIMKCPKYLAWNIPSGTSRLYLYVGDMVDGEFVVDPDYFVAATSQGVYNYMSQAQTACIETDGSKYFYYSKVNDEGIEIVGSDSLPDSDISNYAITPYSPNTSGGQSLSLYNSVIIPSGCFYVIDYGVEGTLIVAVPDNSNEHNYIVKGNKRFGFIEENESFGIIRFPSTTDIASVKIFTNTKKNSDMVIGRNQYVIDDVKNVTTNFKWKSKVAIPWSDSNNRFVLDKDFYGIPYASRWRDAHFVGLEVSLETALNAANDEYSIFYDLTSGRSAINPTRGGTGYGCVCSSTVCFLVGLPYPQTNRGMSYDSNFVFNASANFKKGDFVCKYSDVTDGGHIMFVKEVYSNGYSLLEGIQPCSSVTMHTGKGSYNVLSGSTKVNKIDSYDYVVNLMNGADKSKQFRNYDFELAEGSVRPWRGNKSVYSNADGFIGITIHGEVTTAYIKKPSGTTVSIEVGEDEHVIDIGSYCDEVGVYELSSNISNVKEYFKYVEHDAVTVSVSSDGEITFSDDDIEYAYVEANGFGDNTPLYKGISGYSSMVIHKDSVYKGLSGHIRNVYNAMAYDEWGRYPVSCTLVE